jgi:hypothetical protein
MSAAMVAPMDAMMAHDAMMADGARAMHSEHPAAAASSDGGNGIGGRIVIIVTVVVRIIVVINAADKHAVEVTVMDKGMAGKSRTGRDGGSSRAETRATANDATTETAGGATPAETSATAAAASTSTAMSATNFNRQFTGYRLSGSRHGGIDRREGFGALASKERSDQQRRQCARRT